MIKKDVADQLNKQLERTPWSVVRASNLEVFPRMMDALHHRLETCTECHDLNSACLKYVGDIQLVVKGSVKDKREFEELVERVFDHLKMKHHTVPKGKLLSVHVLVGMLVGLGGGVLLSHWLVDNAVGMGALGWLLGMVAGWSAGKYKERQLKKKNQLF
jgi:F0F1-type ATP synthase assembly protein I